MHHYSFSYSLRVVERFVAIRGRGWGIIRANLDDFYIEDAATLFQTSQFRWNIFKKLVKHLDRVPRADYYTYVKLKELWDYFKDVQKRENVHSAWLTRIKGFRYSLRAPKS